MRVKLSYGVADNPYMGITPAHAGKTHLLEIQNAVF